MSTPSRARRLVRWGGVCGLASLAVCAIASRWWAASWTGEGGVTVVVWHGQLGVGVHRDISDYPGIVGWHAGWEPCPVRWWFWHHSRPLWDYYYVPLWLPCVPLAACSSRPFRGARRASPGSCARCGYDLLGVPLDT